MDHHLVTRKSSFIRKEAQGITELPMGSSHLLYGGTWKLQALLLFMMNFDLIAFEDLKPLLKILPG